MSRFRLPRPPDTGTHPGGHLIHRVAPWVSLGLGDSVETGQVGTPLPGGGHPPATSAAPAACGVPSGQPGARLSGLPQRRRSGEGAVAPPRRHRRAALLPGRQRRFRVRRRLASWERNTSCCVLNRDRAWSRQVEGLRSSHRHSSSLRRPETSPRVSQCASSVPARFCDG